MSNETLFYICGGILVASALVVSFVGLKLRDFPGKLLPVIVLWFVVFVGGAMTFAVLHAQDEESAKAAELNQAGKEIEKGETSGPYEGEGAGGNESEAAEAGEPPAEGEKEPVGPTENETGQKPSNKGEEPSGGGKEAGGGGAAASTTLPLEASATALEFSTTQLTAKAGKVTIDFTNPSPIPHDVVIEQNGKEISGFEPITEGEESVTAELKPGTYTFFCSVPGHRQAGMEGTLTVK